MVAQAELESIELGIFRTQVSVGDVPPPEAHIQSLPVPSEDLNPAPASGREVKVRCISCGKIAVGPETSAGEFEVRRHASGTQARVPAQDHSLNTATVQ